MRRGTRFQFAAAAHIDENAAIHRPQRRPSMTFRGRFFRCLMLCFVIVLCGGATLLAADKASPAPLKVGFAERDITPEIGMEQPGGYGKSFHRAMHDACKVRASVWDDGRERVAVVGLDALLIRRETVEKVRREIHSRCGIPETAILISASHSHSSGPTGMVMPGEFDHASPLVQKLAYEKSSAADRKYLALVEKQLVDAVRAADAARQPALV